MLKHYNSIPRTIQIPGKSFTFRCGCSGILPDQYGISNKFVVPGYNSKTRTKDYWRCRVSNIIHGVNFASKRDHCALLDSQIPHSIIRQFMEKPNCVLCGQALNWKFGSGKTPHLHHNRSNGQIYGFAHSRCNPRALEKEIDRLTKENNRLIKLLRAANHIEP